MKSILCAGATLAACVVLAGVSENFEGMTVGGNLPESGTWTGDGTIGLRAEGSTDKILSVDGTVTCANAEGEAESCATCVFKVKFPEEGVERVDDLTESAGGVEALAGCQVALAAGTVVGGTESDKDNLKVMVYTSDGWIWTGLSVVPATEASVTLSFDYSANSCQVKVGDNYATEGLATTKTDETKKGAWFPLASSSPTSSKVQTLVFIGETTVDDVAISEVGKATLPEVLSTLTVDQTQLNAWGITAEKLISSETVGKSNLTVAEKLECGLDPTNDTKFEAKAITSATDGAVALKVPFATDNGQKYKVIVSDETTNEPQEFTFAGEARSMNDTEKMATLTVNPPLKGKVLKFKVQATAK